MTAQGERHGFEMTQVLSRPRISSMTRDAAKSPNSARSPNGAATPKTSALQQADMVQQPEGFLDTVAGLIVRLIDRVVSSQTVSLREDGRGDLIVQGAPGPGHIIDAADASSGETGGTPPDIGETRGGAGGAMVQLAGSRVELMVSPDRCLFCPLDLPSRAAEFLDGIVRAQIDRLTPWHACDVAFGYSAPVEIESERLTIT